MSENHIEQAWGKFFNVFDYIWNYPLFMADSKSPITLASIIIASILLYFSLKLSKKLSKLLRFRLTTMFKMPRNAAAAIEKISYYLLLILTIIITLDIANVPLTAFTFIGGALAIGLGFGSQNIINNFISGLIIMIEQPIRIGDIVEFNNFFGRISNIGARCTHILTFDNIDIIVPNSTLLENTIINNTLTDEGKLRRNHVLKIHYKNDIKQMKQIMLDFLKAHPGILQDPKPEIYITGVKDFYIHFLLHYWTDMNGEYSNFAILDEFYQYLCDKAKEYNLKIDFFTLQHLDAMINSNNSV